MLENRFELGLVTLRPDDQRLSVSRFAAEPLELVAPAGVAIRSWTDLQQLGFIDHPDGKAMASRLLSRRFPDGPGVRSLPCKGYINQISLILEPVAGGLGFTIIPRYARLAFTRPDAIQVISGEPEVVDTLWLLHRAEWPLSARAELVLQHLRLRLCRPVSRSAVLAKSGFAACFVLGRAGRSCCCSNAAALNLPDGC